MQSIHKPISPQVIFSNKFKTRIELFKQQVQLFLSPNESNSLPTIDKQEARHLLFFLCKEINVSQKNARDEMLTYKNAKTNLSKIFGYKNYCISMSYGTTRNILSQRLKFCLAAIMERPQGSMNNQLEFQQVLRDFILNLYNSGLRDFQSLNFSGLDFSNQVFENCIFNSTKFIGTKLNNVQATNCDFRDCNFSGGVLDGFKLTSCNLSFITIDSPDEYAKLIIQTPKVRQLKDEKQQNIE